MYEITISAEAKYWWRGQGSWIGGACVGVDDGQGVGGGVCQTCKYGYQ